MSQAEAAPVGGLRRSVISMRSFGELAADLSRVFPQVEVDLSVAPFFGFRKRCSWWNQVSRS
jgi:hypothetical protein